MIHHVFGNEIANEIGYLKYKIEDYGKKAGYHPRFPPSLDSSIRIDGRRSFLDSELEEAILSDKAASSNVADLSAEWQRHAAGIHADFFGRVRPPVPLRINVHITRYGTGGSYHPRGSSPLRVDGNSITIMDPIVSRQSLNLAQVIVHETVELIIHGKVLSQKIPHEVKEASVDQLCSCDQLLKIYGPYQKQASYAPYLPNEEEWKNYIRWKEGQVPTWHSL